MTNSKLGCRLANSHASLVQRSTSLLAALALGLAAAGCPLQVPGPDGSTPPPAIAFTGGVVAAGGTVNLTSAGTSVVVSIAITNNPSNLVASWKSSDTKVATVTASGFTATITAVGTGTAAITVTVGNATSSFNVAVTVPQVVASLVISGPATLALGAQQPYAVVAKDAQGNVIDSKNAVWSTVGANDLFQIAQTGGNAATVQVTAVGVGTGSITATLSGYSGTPPNFAVHATGTGVTIVAGSATSVAGTAVSLTATATGGTAGSAQRTAWSVTGAGCSVSPTVGTVSSVNATGAAACVVTATLDSTLAANTTVTFTAPVVPATLVISGVAAINVHAAATTYTAVVKDGKGVDVTSQVVITWSAANAALAVTGSGATASVIGNAVGLTAVRASVTGLSIISFAVTVNPVTLDCSPATVSVLQSPNKTSPVSGQAALRAKDGAGLVVPFIAGVAFGNGLTEAHLPADTNFNFLQTGALAGDGTLPLSFYDTSAVGTSHTATITLFGKSATLTVNTITAGTVTLTSKPADTVPVGSSVLLTVGVTVGGNPATGVPVSLAATGDAIFALPFPATSTDTASVLVNHLGKGTVTASYASTTSTPVALYGVPSFIAGTVPATGGTLSSTPLALQLGASAISASVVLQNINHGTIDLNGEIAGVSFVGTSDNAAVTASCSHSGPGLTCSLTAAAQGSANLHLVWSAADGHPSATLAQDFPITVSAAAAPTFGKGPFTALWTGPASYALSFPAINGSSTAQYTLYLSNAAGADTTDAVLFTSANATSTNPTGGPATLSLALVTPAFSSRWSIGLKASTPGSADSAAQRFTVTTNAATAGALPFLAGRTVLEVTTGATPAVHPLFTVVPAAQTGAQPEHTAPRLSPDGNGGLALTGLLVSGPATVQAYNRAAVATGLAQAGAGSALQTDAQGCGSSGLVRPTLALSALINGTTPAALSTFFTTTPQFSSCDVGNLVYFTGSGGAVAAPLVSQVAHVGNSGLLAYDGSSVRYLDLTGAKPSASLALTDQVTAPGALVAAMPIPYGAGGKTAWVLLGGKLYTASLATLPGTLDSGTTVTGWTTSVPLRMVAAAGSVLVVEVQTAGGAHELWQVAATPGTPMTATRLFDPGILNGDQPTLGATTAAGN